MSDPFQSDKSRLFEQFDRGYSQIALEAVLGQMTDEQVNAANQELNALHSVEQAANEVLRQQQAERDAASAKVALITFGALAIVILGGIGCATLIEKFGNNTVKAA